MDEMQSRVRRATSDDAAIAAPLFAAYRVFYGHPYDEQVAREFLADRLSRGESVVLLAEAPGEGAVGFVQLYPTFSSLGLEPMWILNDLYVDERARGQGVAETLMSAAEEAAQAAGATSMMLETGRDNTAAQSLYRRLGWQLEDGFLTFTKDLGSAS